MIDFILLSVYVFKTLLSILAPNRREFIAAHSRIAFELSCEVKLTTFRYVGPFLIFYYKVWYLLRIQIADIRIGSF
jgi:hypothetical protein